jgi:Fe-S-cluster containining protein
MQSELRRRVFDLYREVDASVKAAGPVCVASGRCCRFKEYGHTLFLSNLEAEVLLADAPSNEAPITADFCPFQKDNLCTAREPRPLGCRIYFCDPNYQETSRRISEESIRRLKDLADEFGVDWQYAPLHTFLNAAAVEPAVAVAKKVSRFSLHLTQD